MKLKTKEVTELGYDFLPLPDFMRRFNIEKTDDAILYSMKVGKIDWMKPARDTFVVLSPKTIEFFALSGVELPKRL